MNSSFNIFSIIFAIGAAQGLFLSVILFNLNSENKPATRTLALIVLCFTLIIGEEFIDAANLYPVFPFTLAITVTVDVLIAPLMLFYAWFITDINRRFKKSHLVHFLPFVLCTLLFLPFFLLDAEQKLTWFQNGIPTHMAAFTYFKTTLCALYLTLAFYHVWTFTKKKSARRHRTNQYRNILWFQRTLLCKRPVNPVL